MGMINKIRRAIACKLIQKKIDLQLEEAVVSFTFDDVPDSGFIHGDSILKKYGFNGTYYISLGLKDDLTKSVPYFDRKHLKTVIDRGGELGCHTHQHLHFYDSGYHVIAKDLKQNQQELDQLFKGCVFENFSYPYGEQTIRAKLALRKQFKSARAVNVGINSSQVDLLNLKAVPLDIYHNVETIKEMINKTVQMKGWIILFTHDVEDKHSDWGYSPAEFEKVVKYVHEQKIKVSTVKEVLKEVR